MPPSLCLLSCSPALLFPACRPVFVFYNQQFRGEDSEILVYSILPRDLFSLMGLLLPKSLVFNLPPQFTAWAYGGGIT